MKKRTLALLLCAVMVLGLAACGKQTATSSTLAISNSSPSASGNNADVSASTPETIINVMALSGPTGVGMAQMMTDAPTTATPYAFTVVADNSEVGPALIKGEVDIACTATNVAANLYSKTEGGITVLAANTLGVLYILAKDDSVTDVSSLRGKTIFAFGQGANPEFVLDHLLTQNGLDPDSDVTIEWMTPQEVTAKMIQSTDGICMLPVPAATALQLQDSAVRQAVDITAAWDEISESPLVMGCIVVRNQFLQEHPELVAHFLADYEASINYMNDPANLTAAAELAAARGITANAAIAAKAIPQCNLTFLTGADMRDALQGYFEVLFEADPTSIGGGIPDDGFYFIP